MNKNKIKLLIKSLNDDQLHPFLCEYAASHPEFYAALLDKFTAKPAEFLSTSYNKEVTNCFYYPKQECDLNKMEKAVYKIWMRANVMKSNGNVGNYASIVLCIMENILLRFDKEEHYCFFDDWYPLQATIDDLGKELKLWFVGDGVSEELRIQIMERLKEIDSRYKNDYGIFDLKILIKELK